MGTTIEVADPAAASSRTLIEAYLDDIDARIPGLDRPCAGSGSIPAGFVPPEGAFLVVRVDGHPVGCGALRRIGADTAEVKRMWIAPAHRGGGLGRALLASLEDQARAHGYRRVVLDTNEALTEAIELYERAGYERVAPYNANPDATHWFAKQLEGPRCTAPSDR